MDEAKQWLSLLVVTKTMRIGSQARQCDCWLTSCDVNPGPGTFHLEDRAGGVWIQSKGPLFCLLSDLALFVGSY